MGWGWRSLCGGLLGDGAVGIKIIVWGYGIVMELVWIKIRDSPL